MKLANVLRALLVAGVLALFATPWACGEAGAPILEDSLGVFECERYAVHNGGDHHILIGQVVKASFDGSLDPLLFFRGRYRRLHFD